MDELEDFVACGEKFTRFRDHRSMPLTGGFGRMKFDQVEKLAEKKCIRLVYNTLFFLEFQVFSIKTTIYFKRNVFFRSRIEI